MYDATGRQAREVQANTESARRPARQVQRHHGPCGGRGQRVGAPTDRCHVPLPSHPGRDDCVRSVSAHQPFDAEVTFVICSKKAKNDLNHLNPVMLESSR